MIPEAIYRNPVQLRSIRHHSRTCRRVCCQNATHVAKKQRRSLSRAVRNLRVLWFVVPPRPALMVPVAAFHPLVNVVKAALDGAGRFVNAGEPLDHIATDAADRPPVVQTATM